MGRPAASGYGSDVSGEGLTVPSVGVRLSSNLGSLALGVNAGGSGGGGSGGASPSGGGLKLDPLKIVRPAVTVSIDGAELYHTAPAGEPSPGLARLPVWVAPAALALGLVWLGWLWGRRHRA